MATQHVLTKPSESSAPEREARIQLAALYRLIEHLGWGEGIYNHIALRVPDDPDAFLIKPHAMRYDEVTASNLIKVDCRADLGEANGVNSVGFNNHAPVIRERRDVNCSIHIHTRPIETVSALRCGLRMVLAQSVVLQDNVGYMDFTGVVERPDAQHVLLEALGDKAVLIMRNHGAIVTGNSVAHAFVMLQRLMTTCEVQLKLMETGSEFIEIEPELCREGAQIFRHHDAVRGGEDWPAWVRVIDRISPDFRD